MIQGRPPWGRLHIFLGGVGAFGAYILLVVVAVGGCRGWWGDNAPAALHNVGGGQWRLRRLHVFLFFWAPSAGHIVGEHDSVVSDDCPTNRVPLLVGLTTMASSPTTAYGIEVAMHHLVVSATPALQAAAPIIHGNVHSLPQPQGIETDSDRSRPGLAAADGFTGKPICQLYEVISW